MSIYRFQISHFDQRYYSCTRNCNATIASFNWVSSYDFYIYLFSVTVRQTSDDILIIDCRVDILKFPTTAFNIRMTHLQFIASSKKRSAHFRSRVISNESFNVGLNAHIYVNNASRSEFIVSIKIASECVSIKFSTSTHHTLVHCLKIAHKIEFINRKKSLL